MWFWVQVTAHFLFSRHFSSPQLKSERMARWCIQGPWFFRVTLYGHRKVKLILMYQVAENQGTHHAVSDLFPDDLHASLHLTNMTSRNKS